MGARAARRGFAIIADVVASRETTDFVHGRDRHLDRLSRHHIERGWIEAPYTVTAWDEFQTYSWQPTSVPSAILELRQEFAPWELKISIGAGALLGWRSRRPINESVGGPAFERARKALDALASASGDKYRRLTRFRTGNGERDRLLNLIYGLHDSLVQDTTERQWETIGYALLDTSQERIATQLDVLPSTVTRNLQRGHYWQMRETLEIVPSLLAGEFHG